MTDAETALTPTSTGPGASGLEPDPSSHPSDSETPPSRSFTDFPIDPAIREALAEMKYERPTEVQAAVIAPALEGSDLVVQSKTGSGKTSAFGIPLVERLPAQAAEPGRPLGLVLVPTRELAHQVADELRRVGSRKGTRVLAVYGGVSLGKQATGLQGGVDIVVGTPGRLLDHIRRRNLHLSAVRMVVLDEADEMLSMGFWEDVTDLIQKAPDGKQTMLFSATLPYEVAKAAAEFLREPARLDLSGDVMTVHGIENLVFHVVPDIPKPRQLLYLLETEQPQSAIIFCNTRNETEMIAKYLTQSGFVAEALSGNFRQADRERVMSRIKRGDLRFMVATDVASRGIDISDLSHVFNYSLPEFTEVYLHRVGRTGRMEKMGTAISLVDGKGLTTLTQLERQYGIEFNERKLPPEGEILQRRSKRIMNELSEKASVAEVGQHIEVAREIIQGDDGAQVVAFLLKQYFMQQAQDGRRNGRGASAPAAERAPARASEGEGESEAEAAAPTEGTRKRRRRRRRRGRGRNGEMETLDAREALGASALPAPVARPSGNGHNGAGNGAPRTEGMSRIRVNIGFDDGFKGRGAVAKKITALAGLNDGIVNEVESGREFALLEATPDIAELLIERVDGAQIGKKIVAVVAAD